MIQSGAYLHTARKPKKKQKDNEKNSVIIGGSVTILFQRVKSKIKHPV